MVSVAKQYNLKLLKKERIAKNTVSFFFQRPKLIDFIPGQFCRLTLNIPDPGERGSSRFFSIASSPTEKDYLMIATNSDHTPFKKSLFSLPPKTAVQITAPYGSFILRPEESNPHIFLAGGIGITPFRSMIRYASDLSLSLPITLFSSFSLVEDIIFKKEFEQIEKKHSWFKFVQTITQPQNSKLAWEGTIGRIDQQFIRKYVTNLPSSLFYIAGPPAMVDAMTDIVKSLGVDESHIRKEKFTGY